MTMTEQRCEKWEKGGWVKNKGKFDSGLSGLLEKNLIMFDNDGLFRRNKSSKGEIS